VEENCDRKSWFVSYFLFAMETYVRLSFARASEVAQRHAKVRKMANEMETDNFADVQPFQLPTSLSMLVSRRCGYFLQCETLYHSHCSLNLTQCLIYDKYQADTFLGCNLLIIKICIFSQKIIYFGKNFIPKFIKLILLCVPFIEKTLFERAARH